MFGGMIIIWIIIISGIVWLIKYIIERDGLVNNKRESRPSALDILQERYARREISREEYEEYKQTLEH